MFNACCWSKFLVLLEDVSEDKMFFDRKQFRVIEDPIVTVALCATQCWAKIVHAVQQLCGHCRTTSGEKCNHIQHNSILRKLQVEQGQPSDTVDSLRSHSLPLSGRHHVASHTVSKSYPPRSFFWHCGLNHLPCQLFKPPQLGASVRRARKFISAISIVSKVSPGRKQITAELLFSMP